MRKALSINQSEIENMVSRLKKTSNDTDTLATSVESNSSICKDTGLFSNGLDKICNQIKKIAQIANRIGDTTLRKSNDFFELEMSLKTKANEIEVPNYFMVEDNIASSTFSNLKLDKEDGEAINKNIIDNQNNADLNLEFDKVTLNNIIKDANLEEERLREINGQNINVNNIDNGNVQSQEVYDGSYKNTDKNVNIRADNVKFTPNLIKIDLSQYENNEDPFFDAFYE